MFLMAFLCAAAPVQAGLPGDLNRDGQVTISEVQRSINGFLGLAADDPNMDSVTIDTICAAIVKANRLVPPFCAFGTLQSIEVFPSSDNASYILPGTTGSLTAIGVFSDGTRRSISDSVLWSSSAPSVATVTNNTDGMFSKTVESPYSGQVSSVAVGTTIIRAVSGNMSGLTLLKVLPAGSFAIPTADADATSLIAGPDGNLWFAERYGNKIGRVSPDGTITEFPLLQGSSSPSQIISGPGGALWFTESGKIGKITTAGTITDFPISTTPRGIAVGSDGNIWFLTYSGLGKLASSGTATTVTLPDAGSFSNFISGADGNFWASGNNKIVKITPSGTVTQYNSYISSLAPGPDGNIWFGESYGLGYITPSGTITRIYPGTGGYTYYVGATSGTNLLLRGSGRIAVATTAGMLTEVITSSIYTSSSTAASLAAGPDGNLWFIDGGGSRIWKFQYPQ